MKISKFLSRSILVSLICGLLSVHLNTATADQDSEASVWVYVQINVPISDGVEDYYYFGRIKESIYESIVNNNVTEAYFRLSDTRYYDDGEYHSTEDEIYTTTMVFRTKDIVIIEKIKGDPLIIDKVPGI